MPVVKKTLSTEMLPPGLSERQRFMGVAELFEHFSNTDELEQGRLATGPLEADRGD